MHFSMGILDACREWALDILLGHHRLHLPSLSWHLHNGLWLTCVTKRPASVLFIYLCVFR